MSCITRSTRASFAGQLPDHILQRNSYLQLHLRLLSETLHLCGSSIIGAGRYDDCHGTLTLLRH